MNSGSTPRGKLFEWVGLGEVSPALTSAVIFAEDKRFDQHEGIDWRAMAGALEGLLSFRNTRGASTITMQLASKLLPDLQPKTSHHSLWQKWKQIQAALEVERSSFKMRSGRLLNLVSFRGELQGIALASRGLFDKKPHGLDTSESVILPLCCAPRVLLLPSSRPSLRAFRKHESSSELLHNCVPRPRRLCRLHIHSTADRPGPSRRPAACGAPRSHSSSEQSLMQMVCTLDQKLQRFSTETLRQHLLSVQGQNVHDGAVLVADNKTGEILAYVGNVGALASARYVDGSSGQTPGRLILKPFLYGLAFDKLLVTPVSLLDDAPLDVTAAKVIYRPENYDKQFHGLVTARTALASSLNIPAVKLLNLIEVESLVQKLGDFGFERLQSPDFYGPSLALGSAHVTLWELVNAYRALANGGVWSPLRLTFEEVLGTRTPAFSGVRLYCLRDSLHRESRSEIFHLESPLGTRFWTAVKTGTSKDMRDNWCVGFSDHYTVGVGQAIFRASQCGTSAASPARHLFGLKS